MTDYTQLYYDIINGPEFKALHIRVGGKITSSPIQIKRCTIEIQDSTTHKWLIFSNGYVREQNFIPYYGSNGDWRAAIVSKPPVDWDNENVTYEMMVDQINKVNKRLDKREAVVLKRAQKLYKYKAKVLDAIFDRESYMYTKGNKTFRGFKPSKDLINEIYYVMSAAEDSWQAIIKK